MLPATMSNSTSLSEEASVCSGSRFHELSSLNPMFSAPSPPQQEKIKKKRNLPGNPDPDAEVIALSPKTLLATNRFVCEVCKKGFQRDQNLQLHRRGHNLPWKLRQRTSKEIIKKVYVCPEPSCVHHHPSRALGDLTGIKKHFCRKHGEKKWKCEKCSKRYAVQSDWKAHTKTCGTREYRCDCGTIFSRKDSFITHRAFCDALAEESARLSTNTLTTNPSDHHSLHLRPHQNPATPLLSSFSYSAQQQQQYRQQQQQHMMMMMSDLSPPTHISLNSWDPHQDPLQVKNEIHHHPDHHHQQQQQQQYQRIPSISASPFLQEPAATGAIPKQLNMNNAPMSATALLQKAANVGAAAITGAAQAQSVSHMASSVAHRLKMDGFNMTAGGHMVGAGISPEYGSGSLANWRKSDRLTRDFLGLAGECCDGGGGGGGPGGGPGGGDEVLMDVDLRDDVLSFDGVVGYPPYDQDESLLKTSTSSGFVFAEQSPETEAWGDC